MRSGAVGITLTIAFSALAIALDLLLDRVLGVPMLPRWGVVLVVMTLASVALARRLGRREQPEE